MAQRDEVEEFLRRAAARRAQAQGQQPRPAAPRPAPPPAPAQQFQPPAQQFQPPPRPATLSEVVMLQPVDPAPGWQPVEAELIEPELVEIGDSVGRSVQEHIRGPQEIAERVRHLGEEVDQADDKLEARLHQVFDHRVGQLKVRPADTVKAPSATTTSAAAFTPGDIALMLLSPANVRSAIVLSEVLRRPDWDERPKGH